MHRKVLSLLTQALFISASSLGIAIAHPQQHGMETGHLTGSGATGVLELVSKVRLTDTQEIIADVTVDPRGTYAYLAHWGKPSCAANSEAGGTNDPDAGVFVVDISDLSNPRKVNFIPSSQDSRPGEGMQAVNIKTKWFDGVMLVSNNEQCGKNGKGGVSLYDVTNPLKPYTLSKHDGDRGFADNNDIHSAFAWQAGDKAYVVTVDNFEATDVDILDITNPKNPELIADLDLNSYIRRTAGKRIHQPALGLEESSLHDMTVKKIGNQFIMLLSYWDGGYVLLDVTNPAAPVFLGDTDYPAVDPELFKATGKTLPPEGNGHQAEFTSDNRFIIGTDEDFSPYRGVFDIASGAHAGRYAAGEFGWTVPIVTLPGRQLTGTTVYGGYGCPGDRASIPPASSIPGTGPKVLVVQRGPVQDPSQVSGACFFSEKVETAQLLGYDAAIVPNHHVGAQAGEAAEAAFCGGKGHAFTVTIPAVCVGHLVQHLLFNSAPRYDVPYVAGTEPTVGQVGEQVTLQATFDGWGYVHLFDGQTLANLDTYAIPEAHDESKSVGFGDLSVHEVATHPVNPRRAYLAYYAGGMHALDIQCSDPSNTSTCKLVKVGAYLDSHGNNFWGVEVFQRNGQTYILGSDRDHGLWIFRDKSNP